VTGRNRLVRPWLTWRLSGALAVVVCLVAAVAWWWTRPASSSGIPVADVTAGDFLDTLALRGDIKPVKSIVLNAPVIGTGDLRIVKLARAGSTVKRGEPVVQFDTTTLQRTLEEKQSELKRAASDIDRAHAQARMQEEQNVTEQTRARNDVERARLDTTAADLLSPVEAQEKKLALSDAQHRLRATDEKVSSGKDGNAADLESLKQKRDKALAEVRQAERNLASMTLTAPADGMVTLMQNYSASSGMSTAPDFREGDRPWPGAAIAELPSMASVVTEAHVDEADRGRLQTGQSVMVRIDALPDKELTGTIKEIGALARADIGSWPPVRNFDVVVALDRSDPSLRPGMSASLRVVVDRVPHTTLVPAGAVFTRDGRSVVYVVAGGGFEMRVVEVSRRNDERVAVTRGVKPGERVALKDPTAAPAAPEAGRK
jgi:RND family efflux transporter MFP subunit